MLCDVLRNFRISAEVYHNAKVCGDWLIREGHLGQTCFHMPTEGNCLLRVPGEPDRILNQGDLVIFPREVAHAMCPASEQVGDQEHLLYHQAKSRIGTGLLCGRIIFEHQGFNAFLDALPKVIIFSHEESADWLDPLLNLIQLESYKSQDSSSLVLDRISELLFVLAIRHHVNKNLDKSGILSLFIHPKLARATQLMHEQPAVNWTLERLATEAAMSRTSFANAFREVSGQTAMQYLTWWRMQLAWTELKKGLSIIEVAGLVGYQSESAFSKVFKKEFGLSAGKVKNLA